MFEEEETLQSLTKQNKRSDFKFKKIFKQVNKSKRIETNKKTEISCFRFVEREIFVWCGVCVCVCIMIKVF